jgi:hypothetical protein
MRINAETRILLPGAARGLQPIMVYKTLTETIR